MYTRPNIDLNQVISLVELNLLSYIITVMVIMVRLTKSSKKHDNLFLKKIFNIFYKST